MAPASSSCVLVFDVGGSHVSAALCHPLSYELGPVVHAQHPDDQSIEAFVDVLASLAAQADGDMSNVSGASLAMPGPFDYVEGVSWMRHKLPYLYGVNLRQELAFRFNLEPGDVRFLNDAAAFLLGEVGTGAARGVSRAVGVTLGTGVGSAFAINGGVETEGPGIPPGGEIWNLPYEGGIVEDLISTRGLQHRYKQSSGKHCEVADIAFAAPSDPAAAAVFADFGRDLGRVFKNLFAAFAPEVVVIGGGIARSAKLFLPQAQQELRGFPIELRISTLGDSAPLVGAGVSWFAGCVCCASVPCECAAKGEPHKTEVCSDVALRSSK
jgi:glucokinase